MTEEVLRAALSEARDKNQTGLLIWANWNTWDDIAFDTKPGEENYDYALSQIAKDKESTCFVEVIGFKLPAYFAVSVSKLSNSDRFFKNVLTKCNKANFQGPVTLVPLNEVCKSF